LFKFLQIFVNRETNRRGRPGGGGWGGSNPPPPRNSEGPQNRAKLNQIVKTVKNC